MTIALVVPSRGRPASIKRLANAIETTISSGTDANIKLIVGLDHDDPQRAEYPPGDYMIREGLRSVVPWMNEMAVPAAELYPYVGMLGDDHVPRTDGWNEQILSALQLTPFVFANDLYPREPGSHPTHLFVRSEVVRALGYLGVPTLKHMFCDNAWMLWGKECGITYLHNVVIEHLHFTVGKSSFDETYDVAAKNWHNDEAAWEMYNTDGSLTRDIDKIKAVL